MPCRDIEKYVLTNHARFQMQRRSITEAEVATVLAAPEQREEVGPTRCVYQSRLTIGKSPTIYLLRVFVDTTPEPAEVVTVYQTSKLEKYWR